MSTRRSGTPGAAGPPVPGTSTRQPSPKRVTLAEVAKAAGVSPTAASFVLAGRDEMRISAATQQRIRELAAELGYRPNLAARSLRTGRSGTVGLISSSVTSSDYAGGLVAGALTAARDQGALLYIAETLDDAEIQEQLLRGMLDRHVDGFILAAMYTRPLVVPDVLDGQPVVLLNSVPDRSGLGCVLPDERAAGADAARLLLAAGHRENVYLLGGMPAGRTPPYALVERAAGAKKVLRRAGVSLLAAPPVDDWTPADARAAVTQLLASGTRPGAMICCNDRLALGAYQAFARVGLTVGEDISVVSFDNTELASWMEPGLTSIGLPHFEMGAAAVRLLLSGEPQQVVVPMPVCLRASVIPNQAA